MGLEALFSTVILIRRQVSWHEINFFYFLEDVRLERTQNFGWLIISLLIYVQIDI
jgi:hypothetical protein